VSLATAVLVALVTTFNVGLLVGICLALAGPRQDVRPPLPTDLDRRLRLADGAARQRAPAVAMTDQRIMTREPSPADLTRWLCRTLLLFNYRHERDDVTESGLSNNQGFSSQIRMQAPDLRKLYNHPEL
jgi:hypothetical protein